ncbi:hypothetical protein M0802_006306 [Mischocyttarus mexicanus]|nr:hypothetical protein M0802_006306 [Mischocyttarus mexicanus]
MHTSKKVNRNSNSKESVNARLLSNRSKIKNKITDLTTETIETARKLLQLELDCNYQIIQVNGQRKFGPPLYWNGPAPDPKCEVFVGGIPRTIFEPDLYPIFSLVGFIYEIRLMMDFSGTNRGFGFIMYTNPEDAYHAVKKLNHYEICPGHRIGVVTSINHRRLQIKQLPLNIEAKNVIQRVYDITDEVYEVRVYRNIDESERYALISYDTHRGAAIARKRLLPLTFNLFSNSKVVIDWANPSFYPTDVFEERGTIDTNGKIILTKTFVSSTEKPSKSVQNLSKIYEHKQLTFGRNENNCIADNLINLDESLPSSYSLDKKFTRSRSLSSNFANENVKPSKSSIQGRGKTNPSKTKNSSKIVPFNGDDGNFRSNLNSQNLSFFQQNNSVFSNDTIERSSFQNDLKSNHITKFEGDPNKRNSCLNCQLKTTLLQSEEVLWKNDLIQSYLFSQANNNNNNNNNNISQSYSNINTNFNQNYSTNLNNQNCQTNQINLTNHQWYPINIPNMINYNNPNEQTYNSQDFQQNQLLGEIYNLPNIFPKNVTKNDDNNKTNVNASSYYSLWPPVDHFEQEKDINCINLINPLNCYVQEDFSSGNDRNNNTFITLNHSQGRPILKKNL